MKKCISLVVIGILSVLLLAACGGNSGTNTQDNNNDANHQKKPAEKAEILVSAASSLTDVAEEIKTVFNKNNPHITVTYNFAGSGKLSQQIQQGAPVDIFMSASKKDMDFLAKNDLIVEDSRFDFASNEIVVITQKTEEINISSLEDLTELEIDHIIFGDVEAMPIGRYAKEALDNVGVWEALRSKMVFASTLNQIITHVEEGNGEIGFVFSTDAIRSEDVKVILKVDPNLHGPVIYPAAAITSSKNLDAAQAYLDFLAGDEGKAVLKSHGFIVD